MKFNWFGVEVEFLHFHIGFLVLLIVLANAHTERSVLSILRVNIS